MFNQWLTGIQRGVMRACEDVTEVQPRRLSPHPDSMRACQGLTDTRQCLMDALQGLTRIHEGRMDAS